MKNILISLLKVFKPGWLKMGLWLVLGLLAMLLYSYKQYTSMASWFELRGLPFNFLTLEGCSQVRFCITSIQISHPWLFALDCIFWYVCACVLIEIRNSKIAQRMHQAYTKQALNRH